MNADIDASADIDSTKIDLSSSGYLATGTPTATITGDWTFEGQTNIDALIASIATIGTLDVDSVTMATGMATSLMTIAYLQSDYADITSLATLANINVENVNNATYVSVPTSGWTNMEVFTSSGTWTKPASVDKVYVKVVGGGGGGECGTTRAGGGGGGGYSEGLIAVTGNVTVTVGAAGISGTLGQSNTAGGTSSFAGTSTIQATGGGAGRDNNAVSGGTGSGGSLNLVGGFGIPGVSSGDNYGISGGNSVMGYGGFIVYGSVGTAGTGYGGGGGAGRGTSSSKNGAAGTAGVVIVYWTE